MSVMQRAGLTRTKTPTQIFKIPGLQVPHMSPLERGYAKETSCLNTTELTRVSKLQTAQN